MSHDRDKPRIAVHDNAIDITFTVGLYSHTVTVDPEDAWDLGDDLIIASSDLIAWEPVGFTTFPPWPDGIQVAVLQSEAAALPRLAVICDDHGTIHYPGMRIPLSEVWDLARAHWRQQHSADAEVSEDTESEDEHGQGQPAQADAAGEVAGREDGQDRGDDVQDHGKHRPIPPPGGVMAW